MNSKLSLLTRCVVRIYRTKVPDENRYLAIVLLAAVSALWLYSTNMDYLVDEKHHFMRGLQNFVSKFYQLHDNSNESITVKPSPVINVTCLKVRKLTSCTLQNIFLRFGMKRNLTFLLPRKTNKFENVINPNGSITDNYTIPRRGNEVFNIMCFHVFYNKTVYRKYFPPDTVNIGIVREPYKHFLSWMSYIKGGYVDKLNRQNTSLCQYIKSQAYIDGHEMARDFGFPDDILKNFNKRRTDEYSNQLNEDFKLVILVEYFDESIVLMRRMIHWSTQDIIYMKLNRNQNKCIFKINNQTCVDLYYSKAKIDFLLYEYFYRKLWQKIKNEGSDFEMELLQFRKIQEKVVLFCSSRSNVPLYVKALPWSDNFYLTRDQCFLLKIYELHFIDLLRKMQYGNTIYT